MSSAVTGPLMRTISDGMRGRDLQQLIAAGLIVAGEFALQPNSAKMEHAPRATPQQTFDAPAFVRPSRPSLNMPGIHVGRPIRIG